MWQCSCEEENLDSHVGAFKRTPTTARPLMWETDKFKFLLSTTILFAIFQTKGVMNGNVTVADSNLQHFECTNIFQCGAYFSMPVENYSFILLTDRLTSSALQTFWNLSLGGVRWMLPSKIREMAENLCVDHWPNSNGVNSPDKMFRRSCSTLEEMERLFLTPSSEFYMIKYLQH